MLLEELGGRWRPGWGVLRRPRDVAARTPKRADFEGLRFKIARNPEHSASARKSCGLEIAEIDAPERNGRRNV
jgi:hypothetical protein